MARSMKSEVLTSSSSNERDTSASAAYGKSVGMFLRRIEQWCKPVLYEYGCGIGARREFSAANVRSFKRLHSHQPTQLHQKVDDEVTTTMADEYGEPRFPFTLTLTPGL